MSTSPGRQAPAGRRRSEWLFERGVGVRVVVLWLVTLTIMFVSFGLHLWLGNGYEQVAAVPPERASTRLLPLLLTIWGINLANALVIGFTSTLFRFGPVNVGTLYLTVQVVMIGRIAGLNRFEYPMANVGEGLLQFLRVGLWEVTAYAIVAGVTLTKARWIADRPGASTWRERRTWAELDWGRTEWTMLAVATVLLLGSGVVEALWIVQR